MITHHLCERRGRVTEVLRSRRLRLQADAAMDRRLSNAVDDPAEYALLTDSILNVSVRWAWFLR